VTFQVLKAASMDFRVFWDVALCSHVEVDRRFRGAYCLHYQGDDDGLMTQAERTLETSDNFNVTKFWSENLNRIVDVLTAVEMTMFFWVTTFRRNILYQFSGLKM
jgi:hypothetical protein